MSNLRMLKSLMITSINDQCRDCETSRDFSGTEISKSCVWIYTVNMVQMLNYTKITPHKLFQTIIKACVILI